MTLREKERNINLLALSALSCTRCEISIHALIGEAEAENLESASNKRAY